MFVLCGSSAEIERRNIQNGHENVHAGQGNV